MINKDHLECEREAKIIHRHDILDQALLYVIRLQHICLAKVQKKVFIHLLMLLAQHFLSTCINTVSSNFDTLSCFDVLDLICVKISQQLGASSSVGPDFYCRACVSLTRCDRTTVKYRIWCWQTVFRSKPVMLASPRSFWKYIDSFIILIPVFTLRRSRAQQPYEDPKYLMFFVAEISLFELVARHSCFYEFYSCA